MTAHCIFEGCEHPRAFLSQYGTTWLCPDHASTLRSVPWTDHSIKLAVYDAPTAILDSALVASRSSQDDADKAWRRRQREHRRALQTELRGMRA